MNRSYRYVKFLVGLALIFVPWAVAAQQYPDKAITMVIGYPPGGPSDLLGRIIADRLSNELGKPVVVRNMPGAGSSLSVAAVARASNDGYTVLFTTSSFIMNPFIYKDVGYDPIEDFIPIAQVGSIPFCILMLPSSPINSIEELISTSKAKPGALRYSTGGVGSGGYLIMEQFKSMTGLNSLNIQHIPYKGLAPATAGLLGGQVELTIAGINSALSYVKAGRVKVIAVTTKERVHWLPNIPTIAESGVPGFDFSQWNALFLPKGASKQVVGVLRAAAHKIFKTPDKALTDNYETFGMTLPPLQSEEAMTAFLKDELAHWRKIITQL